MKDSKEVMQRALERLENQVNRLIKQRDGVLNEKLQAEGEIVRLQLEITDLDGEVRNLTQLIEERKKAALTQQEAINELQ